MSPYLDKSVGALMEERTTQLKRIEELVLAESFPAKLTDASAPGPLCLRPIAGLGQGGPCPASGHEDITQSGALIADRARSSKPNVIRAKRMLNYCIVVHVLP
ncbi:hypothetical protein Ancab_018443 [Ancistrocladus abbreviatus]